MKLSTARVQRTLSQLEAREIPEDHPLVPQLNMLFGEHTFFLDGDGLIIVEPAGPPSPDAEDGRVVKLASWDDDGTSLLPHDPEPTGVVVALGSDGPMTLH